MTAVLPQGLIYATTTTPVPGGEGNNAEVDAQGVLRSLWTVYRLQSKATQDPRSIRSRNLCWRIWSSPRLIPIITTPVSMSLLNRCSAEFNLNLIGNSIELPPLRTTPAPQLGNLSPATSCSQSNAVPSNHETIRFPAVTRDPLLQQHRRLSGNAGSASRRQQEDTSGSTSQTTSDSGSRPSFARSASGGRSKHVVATGGKARMRPTISRRKSSTPKPPSNQSGPKSPDSDQPSRRTSIVVVEPSNEVLATGTSERFPQLVPDITPTASGTTFALPSASSWQSLDSAVDAVPSAATAPQPHLQDLVDPGFRSKFVENQKKLSSVNLTGLAKVRKNSSTVRFADDAPEVDGKGKASEILSTILDVGDHSTSGRALEAGDDISSEDNEDDDARPLELPRSKSQLSLMIRHQREETGSQDLGPQLGSVEGSSRPKGKTKEEELLSMARRDGVTRAGGVQGSKAQRVRDQNHTGSSTSSSPEPLF